MRKYLKPVFAIIFTSAIAFTALAHGDIKNQIERTMGWGKIDPLYHMLDDDEITLSLFSDQQTVSKDEAKERMSKFFEEYQPVSCSITSQGKHRSGTRYFSGTYTTEDSTYSAYFEAELDQDEGHYHLSMITVE